MTTLVESAVPLAEVAKRAGLSVAEVRAEAESLGLFVGLDWKHEEAVTAAEAFALVDGSARRNLEHENAFRAYQRALEQWQADRESARRAAFQEGWKAGVRGGLNNSPAMDMGHQASRDAVAAFERANPEPQFREPDSGRLQSWLRRVTVAAR
jgi:hypothetical protein